MINCGTVVSVHNLFCSFSLIFFSSFFSKNLKFHQAAAHISSAAVLRDTEKILDIFKREVNKSIIRKREFHDVLKESVSVGEEI